MLSKLLDRILPDFIVATKLMEFRTQWMFGIVAFQILAVFFEAIGVGFIVPILEYMRNTGDFEALAKDSQIWSTVIDAFDFVGLKPSFAALLCLAFTAIVLRQTFMYFRMNYTNFIQNELIRRGRNRLFETYLRSNLQEQERSLSGNVVNDMTVELQRAVGALRAAVEFMALSLLACGYIMVVFAMSVPLSIAATFILSVVGFVLFRLTRQVRELGIIITELNQRIAAFLIERLTAIRLVRLSGLEDGETEMFRSFTKHQKITTIKLQKLQVLFNVLIEPIVLLFAFTLLLFSVEGNFLDFETTILFFFILMRLVPISRESMIQRQSYVATYGSIRAVSKRMNALSGAKESAGGPRNFTKLKAGISFANVNFSYHGPDAPPALSDICLTIPAGKMTALVGQSGSGKSTLIDLLPRLRNFDSGAIKFDGIPQSEFSATSLRGAIAFVPQRAQLFDVSPATHIRFGKADATDEEAQEAAKLAGAHDFIVALPNGYETQLGENGGRLSGGQRQRLDMARALVRKAPILILDEPTSNLDAESEQHFRDVLKKILSNNDVTVIIIGHRLSTIKDADQIIVLNHGQVAASGNHAFLLAQGGWYAKAASSQVTDLADNVPFSKSKNKAN